MFVYLISIIWFGHSTGEEVHFTCRSRGKHNPMSWALIAGGAKPAESRLSAALSVVATSFSLSLSSTWLCYRNHMGTTDMIKYKGRVWGFEQKKQPRCRRIGGCDESSSANCMQVENTAYMFNSQTYIVNICSCSIYYRYCVI